MCGICGEWRFDGRPVDQDALQRMLACLRRRGPDAVGVHTEAMLGFGHRRLSVIDLSVQSHQPMLDEQLGLVLVFNGAIYNYRELRTELSSMGYHFFSEGDTEVILKAYHAWGEECPKHLHGMFAFVLWDRKTRSLFAARDRFGIKPLYYASSDKHFLFASNPQALLEHGTLERTLDAEALNFQFSLHGVVPAPRTILKDVRKLEPAHSMYIDAQGKISKHRYWSLNARRTPQDRTEVAWIEAVHETLRTAVRRRYDVADVPVGVLLSGGLDSSLLVALLAELGVKNLRTFSIGFEDQPEEKGSEFEYSDLVVERYQTHHHKFIVPNELVLQRLPEAVDNMAEPMFGQDAIAFYLLAEQVSREIKVVQSGQGADEVFGGYFWYPRMLAETGGTPLERFSKHYFDRDHEEAREMLQPGWRVENLVADYVTAALNEPNADSFMDQVLRLDVTRLIVDDPVKRVDNMTMAWGLEARVPFLDHEVIELAARCPPELRLRERGKYLLKRLARGLVPDAVIDRPKGYFPMPALKYVRGDFLAFTRDILYSRASRERGLFNPDYVELLLTAPEAHLTRIQGSKLWQLALFELWLQRHGV